MTVSSIIRVVFIWKTIPCGWSAGKGALAGRREPVPRPDAPRPHSRDALGQNAQLSRHHVLGTEVKPCSLKCGSKVNALRTLPALIRWKLV